MNFVQKIEKFIEDNGMLSHGDTVVMGVSGGADSVALFLVLNELKEKLGINLSVVHINHGIRKEAVEEAEYVETLCRKYGISYKLYEYDVNALSKEAGIGTEEMGRRLRYEAFNEVASSIDRAVIAVAHNMNDRAETMLFHLCRGTGARGLSSIKPVRDNIIRPLLCVTRQEIEAYVQEKGTRFYVDATNKTDDYTRNRIRNHVIPAMEQYVSKEAVEHMAEAASQLNELTAFADMCTEKCYKEVLISGGETVSIDLQKLRVQSPYIQKMIVKRVIDELVPGNRDITHVHLESVVDLFTKTGNHSVNLPYGIVFTVSYNCLEATIGQKAQTRTICEAVIPGNRLSIAGEGTFEFSVTAKQKDFEPTINLYTKSLAYDRIKGPLVIRTRRTGDYISVNNRGGTKKLKDYFIDEKIPSAERDNILLLADGNHILWVVGYRISESAKVTEETKQIFTVTFTKEDK